MNLPKLEQLIYEVELFTTASTDARILDKVRHITDLFELVVMELQAEYKLQQSIEQMGDKRKWDTSFSTTPQNEECKLFITPSTIIRGFLLK